MKNFKTSRLIAVVLSLVFFLETVSTPALAWGEKQTQNMDFRFSTIYPKSFLQSTTGKVIMYVGSAIVVAAITYFTAGTGTAATAGPIATFIGGTIGGMKGLTGIAAINAGLAMLGGGAVVSGGLGILGGITVLSAIGDLGLAAVLDVATLALPKNSTHEFLEIIKLPMFYEKVSSAAKGNLNDLKKSLKKSLDEADSEKIISSLKQIEDKLTEEVGKTTDETTAYNHLMLSIIQYNNRDFVKARQSARSARRFVDPAKSSVLDYLEALLYLTEGKEKESVKLLFKITQQEPKVIQPYVVLAQIDYDNKNYIPAYNTLQRGLNDADDEDCTLNWMAGNCLYIEGEYKKAIPFYKEALSNMTQNEMEALYKLNIGKCYKKMGDAERGAEWLEDAIGEVEKNARMVEALKQEYTGGE